MAAPIESLITDYLLGHDDAKSGEIARELFKKNASLAEVVEKMGDFLTSTVVENRRRGTQLLAEILQKLPTDFLSDKEVGHVTAFLVSKLSDHHSIQPFALHGLAALTSFSSFCDANTSQLICREIFKEVQNQSMKQVDRRATYTVFLNLLTLHLADIQPLGDTFVCGYIQEMDGEKDPRNLMLAFYCSRLICQYFPLGAMEEEMFEVNSCYFPVDFIPPANDPHGITQDDLHQALTKVMASRPTFAKYCYPLLLEKLSSDVTSAKLDALNALKECIPVYETRYLLEYLNNIVTHIIREVRACLSNDLLTASLQCMSAIVLQLALVPQQLQEFMAETGADLVRQVETDNPTLRLAAMRMLSTMGGASAEVCHAVSVRLLPVVCKACQNISQLEQHTPFFSALTLHLQHVADFQQTSLDWSSLQEWRGQIQDFCDSLLASRDSHLQVLGMQGLCSLAMWTSVLPAEEIAVISNKIVTKALAADTDSLREECQIALNKIVQKQRHADSIISRLSGVLHDRSSTNDRCQTFENCSAILASVAADKTSSESVCNVFLQILQAYRPGVEERVVSVSKSLSLVLSSSQLSPDFIISTVIPTSLAVLNFQFRLWPQEKHQIHASVLSSLVEGLRSQLMFLDFETCEKAVSTITSFVISGETGGGDDLYGPPLKSFSHWQTSRLVQLLLSVSPCLTLQQSKVTDDLLPSLIELCLKAVDRQTQEQSCRCVAALINRMPSGSALDNTVSDLSAQLMSTLSKQAAPYLDLQKNSLNLMVWLTKAMVVRGHKTSTDLTSRLLDLLASPSVGASVADSFHTIVAQHSDVLCPAVRAVVSPTFQQRFVIHNLPPVLSAFKVAAAELKENYLLAIAGMLSSLPQHVLVTELPQLMPTLVLSLEGANSSLHAQALTTLLAGLKHAPDLVTSYLSDLLPNCLRLCSCGAAMKVRILAVRCMGEMVHLPSVALQPHRSAVIIALKPVLDDHKRLVRKEAAAVSSAWCLL